MESHHPQPGKVGGRYAATLALSALPKSPPVMCEPSGLPRRTDPDRHTTARPRAHDLEDEPDQHEQHSDIDGAIASAREFGARRAEPALGETAPALRRHVH